MKKILVILGLLAGNCALAQNNVDGDAAPFNKFSIDVLAPLQFNYNSTVELFQPKVISNGIRLNMKIKQESIGVFGQVLFFSNAPSPFANKMALKMKYTDSPNATAPLGDVFLSSNPALLLTQPGGSKSTKHYKYLFDLKLNPPSTFDGLQSQNFSIIYTFSLL